MRNEAYASDVLSALKTGLLTVPSPKNEDERIAAAEAAARAAATLHLGCAFRGEVTHEMIECLTARIMICCAEAMEELNRQQQGKLPGEKITISAYPIRGKDLKPGDLFSTEGPDYWNRVGIHEEGRGVGERVYIRTNRPAGPDQGAVVYKIEVVR